MSKKNYYFILGIQSYASHDSGACIIKFDNKNKFVDYVAISEDRLVRKKHTYAFPIHSIYSCMKHFNIKSLKDISFLYTDWIKEKKWFRSGPGYNYQMYDYLKEKFAFNKKNIIQINHHLCHAASTYYTSGFNKSSILIIDGLGSDNETHSIFKARRKKIELVERYKHRGIGSLYAAVTEKIGLGFGGEGKTMGLAPYGKKGNFFNGYNFKNIETNFSKIMPRHPLSDVLNHKHANFKRPKLKIKIKQNRSKKISNYFKNIAFSIQDLAEDTMVHLGKYTKKITKDNKLCLAGGVALNSVGNNKILKVSKFKDMFVFPACSDAGIPFGAAVWGYFNHLKRKKEINFINAYTGIYHDLNIIKKILLQNNITFKSYNKTFIANKIFEGKIIGRCVGRSEYGPRALGNRSILADPRSNKMRDYLNKYVKHRELFRPFAPAILEEKSKEYFDIKKSPYMLQVAKVKNFKKIPAASHVDGTARVQTVNIKQNKEFYNLIKEFGEISKIPCLLNTSFNDAGEPIVETHLDALICFLSTKIDYLILDDIVLEKNKIKNVKNILNKLRVIRKKQIKKQELDAKKILFKNLDLKEYKKRKTQNTKIAIEEVLNKPYKNFKKIFDDLKKNKIKKTLIIGSNDHTNILINLLKIKSNFNIDYLETNENDIFKKKKFITVFNKIEKIEKNYDIILVSSYEHQFEIEKNFELRKKNSYLPFYNNRNRSIIDYSFIKKYGSKYPIYSKNLF
tara:strand:+ start:1771 stop:3981 length:2211 start_codon:yes stop_codon:yes gene_type:complete